MIEISAAAFVFYSLALIMFGAALLGGVMAFLQRYDRLTPAVREAVAEMRAIVALVSMTDADRNAQYQLGFNDGVSSGWQNAMESMNEEPTTADDGEG